MKHFYWLLALILFPGMMCKVMPDLTPPQLDKVFGDSEISYNLEYTSRRIAFFGNSAQAYVQERDHGRLVHRETYNLTGEIVFAEFNESKGHYGHGGTLNFEYFLIPGATQYLVAYVPKSKFLSINQTVMTLGGNQATMKRLKPYRVHWEINPVNEMDTLIFVQFEFKDIRDDRVSTVIDTIRID